MYIHHVCLDVVVVGSFSGILRVYVPSHSTFSPDHLLLEKELSLPIIKLGVAKLTRYTPTWGNIIIIILK